MCSHRPIFPLTCTCKVHPYAYIGQVDRQPRQCLETAECRLCGLTTQQFATTEHAEATISYYALLSGLLWSTDERRVGRQEDLLQRHHGAWASWSDTNANGETDRRQTEAGSPSAGRRRAAAAGPAVGQIKTTGRRRLNSGAAGVAGQMCSLPAQPAKVVEGSKR